MSRPPPPPESANRPGDRPRISDERLVGALDACPSLKPAERAAVCAAMARFVERGRLPTMMRDHMMAVARVYKLFAATGTKASPKKAKPIAIDGGDNFSVRWTAGTDFAAKILERYTAKDKKTGELAIRPPVRRAG